VNKEPFGLYTSTNPIISSTICG